MAGVSELKLSVRASNALFYSGIVRICDIPRATFGLVRLRHVGHVTAREILSAVAAYEKEHGADISDSPVVELPCDLRDWFAGQVDITWDVAWVHTKEQLQITSPTTDEVQASRVELRYMEADAMLAYRAKQVPNA